SCTTIEDGTCSIVLSTTGSLNTIGSKSLYVPSNNILIEVSSNDNGGGGGGGSYTPAEKTFSISNALEFLSQNKDSASISVHDWMAIAAGAGDNSNLKSSISDYLKSNPIDSSVVTDNERRAMALMSLGINPYSGTEINYIQKITDSFDGTQFGDKD
ncbi:MAG: hypothetical protein Q8P60_11540, partial [Pseudorhodobacter sp.]|nr:hypothetical protein [Pseudorhodobacter sp.]